MHVGGWARHSTGEIRFTPSAERTVQVVLRTRQPGEQTGEYRSGRTFVSLFGRFSHLEVAEALHFCLCLGTLARASTQSAWMLCRLRVSLSTHSCSAPFLPPPPPTTRAPRNSSPLFLVFLLPGYAHRRALYGAPAKKGMEDVRTARQKKRERLCDINVCFCFVMPALYKLLL